MAISAKDPATGNVYIEVNAEAAKSKKIIPIKPIDLKTFQTYSKRLSYKGFLKSAGFRCLRGLSDEEELKKGRSRPHDTQILRARLLKLER